MRHFRFYKKNSKLFFIKWLNMQKKKNIFYFLKKINFKRKKFRIKYKKELECIKLELTKQK